MAKMYGERKTVGLSDLCEALKTIPQLKQAPLEKIVLDGIRKQAADAINRSCVSGLVSSSNSVETASSHMTCSAPVSTRTRRLIRFKMP